MYERLRRRVLRSGRWWLVGFGCLSDCRSTTGPSTWSCAPWSCARFRTRPRALAQLRRVLAADGPLAVHRARAGLGFAARGLAGPARAAVALVLRQAADVISRRRAGRCSGFRLGAMRGVSWRGMPGDRAPARDRRGAPMTSVVLAAGGERRRRVGGRRARRPDQRRASTCVVPSSIVGTSAGALVAARLAAGIDPRTDAARHARRRATASALVSLVVISPPPGTDAGGTIHGPPARARAARDGDVTGRRRRRSSRGSAR